MRARDGRRRCGVRSDAAAQGTAVPRTRCCEHLALSAHRDVLRQLAFASIVNFDGNADGAWKLALGSKSLRTNLRSFVECVPFISDASVRAGSTTGLRRCSTACRNRWAEPVRRGTRRRRREQAAAAFEIRRAAMRALTQIRGRETETFHKLAQFVREGVTGRRPSMRCNPFRAPRGPRRRPVR